MNKLQTRVINLLKEIDALCRSNSIEYSLTEKTAVMAVDASVWTCDEYQAEIMLTLDNYKKLIELLGNNREGKRALETAENNSRLEGAFARYVDEETTLIDVRRGVNYRRLGAAVVIRPLLETAPKGRLEKLRARAVRLNQRASLAAETRYGGKKRRIKSLLLIILRSVLGNASAYTRSVMRRNKKAKKLYYYSGFGEKRSISRDLLSDYADISFEGNTFMIVADKEGLLEILRGGKHNRSNQKSGYNMESLAVVENADISYRELLKDLSIGKMAASYHEYVCYRKNVYAPAHRESDRQWKHVSRTKDRFSLWEHYEGSRAEILEKYRESGADAIREELAPYISRIEAYAELGLGFSIDSELFDICIELLKTDGRGTLAKKAVKLLPAEYRCNVGEYLENEGFTIPDK